MSDAIASVLSQIRAMQAQVRVEAAPVAVAKETGATSAPGFAETLKATLQQVNGAQTQARDLATAFELGDPRADLARVMVAQQQAQVAFRATVEVRNRLVQAYQDVMNMPL